MASTQKQLQDLFDSIRGIDRDDNCRIYTRPKTIDRDRLLVFLEVGVKSFEKLQAKGDVLDLALGTGGAGALNAVIAALSTGHFDSVETKAS